MAVCSFNCMNQNNLSYWVESEATFLPEVFVLPSHIYPTEWLAPYPLFRDTVDNLMLSTNPLNVNKSVGLQVRLLNQGSHNAMKQHF